MSDLIERVARRICIDVGGDPDYYYPEHKCVMWQLKHIREQARGSVMAVLTHFSEPGNVTEAMGIAWVKAMDWDEPSSADTIASAMRAALSELQAKEAGE